MTRRRALVLIGLVALALPQIVPAQIADSSGPRSANPPCQTLVLFHRPGCPFCERAHEFLDQLQAEQPNLIIHRRDIRQDLEARAMFFALSERFGVGRPSVPAFLVCEQFSVGFDSAATTGANIRAQLAGDSVSLEQQVGGLAGRRFTNLTVEQLGLPLFTIAIGLLDGFNPCAMWVLLFLLSLLVGVTSRRRTILIAGTFVLVSGLMYFAFMAAWLNAFLLIGFSRALQLLLGMVATAMGAIHIKDFFAFQRGVSLSIPEWAKPSLFARARRVVLTRDIAASLIGVVLLAALVNVVEFLCTAGLPAVYTQILSQKALSTPAYYGYLALYNLAYIFDDALMVTLAVVSLRKWKLQERHGRWLKLVSGLTIAILGALLIFAPSLLI